MVLSQRTLRSGFLVSKVIAFEPPALPSAARAPATSAATRDLRVCRPAPLPHVIIPLLLLVNFLVMLRRAAVSPLGLPTEEPQSTRRVPVCPAMLSGGTRLALALEGRQPGDSNRSLNGHAV